MMYSPHISILGSFLYATQHNGTKNSIISVNLQQNNTITQISFTHKYIFQGMLVFAKEKQPKGKLCPIVNLNN